MSNEIKGDYTDQLVRRMRGSKSQNQMGCILDVNVQLALLAERCLHPHNLAKNPSQVVELVTEFQQRPTTQIATGGNPLSVIEIRPPGGKVLPNLTANG
ncbi:MAG: hypothetical protein JW384_01999 [Nitrosomonadaceae bacterium]|nr:hypothetical protein [Nitrosomonadaceae bacterium]